MERGAVTGNPRGSPPRHRRTGLPFFGGLLSAAVLYVAGEETRAQQAIWFALVPFLYSLHGASTAPGRRFLHGATFLGALSLAFTRADWTPLILAAHGGFFALAAGPILRSPRFAARTLGLPLLWAGLEVFRGPLCPFPAHLAPGWLVAGGFVEPGSPQSQAASIIGLHGLSALVALASALFLGVLLERDFLRQLACLLGGLTIPVALQGLGLRTLSESPPPGPPVSVAVVSVASGDPGELEAASRRLPASEGKIVVWPGFSAGGASPEASQALQKSLAFFAQDRGAVLISGLCRSPAGRPGEALPLAATPAGLLDGARTERLLSLPRELQGKVGMGLGEELDTSYFAREAVQGGAQLLSLAGAESDAWRPEAVRFRDRCAAFRAIETRRWVVRASRRSGIVVDPLGRAALDLRGLEGAASTEAAWLTSLTPCVRWGWWIEAALLAGAGWVLVGAMIEWLARKRWAEEARRSKLAG